MILALVLALVFLVAGALLLVYADRIVESSKRPGAHWVIPESSRLMVIRVVGGVYLVIGLLIAYGGVRSGA